MIRDKYKKPSLGGPKQSPDRKVDDCLNELHVNDCFVPRNDATLQSVDKLRMKTGRTMMGGAVARA